MDKLNLDDGNILHSMDMTEFEENGIIPKLVFILAKEYPDEVKLSPEIKAQLKQCCQPQELPFVQCSVVDGIAVPQQYRKRCKK